MGHTLAIFGITGRTGRALAAEGARRGWRLRGLVRPATPAPDGLASLVTIRGAFTDDARVAEAIDDANAVCCVIGPRALSTDAFCAAATAAIIRAMRATGGRRLICQTGAMIGAFENRSWLFERVARSFARRAPAAARDRVEQERLVAESDLDWTIVKPPRLTDGPATGSAAAGPSLPVGLLSRIRRADLAAFLLDELERPRFSRMRVFVKG